MDFKKEKRLIAYITAGDPSIETGENIARSLHENGADIVEIGIPSSNPFCDGPVIRRSVERSITAGSDVKKSLKLAEKLSKEMPIVIMSYREPLVKYGLQRFLKEAVSTNIWGILITDLKPEEEDLLVLETSGKRTNPIFIVSPEDREERLRKLSKIARGFLYCRTSMEKTGTKKQHGDLESYIERLRVHFDIPLALGFGIDGPEKAGSLSEMVDGVIVGTAIVGRIEKKEETASFIRSLKEALSSFQENTKKHHSSVSPLI